MHQRRFSGAEKQGVRSGALVSKGKPYMTLIASNYRWNAQERSSWADPFHTSKIECWLQFWECSGRFQGSSPGFTGFGKVRKPFFPLQFFLVFFMTFVFSFLFFQKSNNFRKCSMYSKIVQNFKTCWLSKIIFIISKIVHISKEWSCFPKIVPNFKNILFFKIMFVLFIKNLWNLKFCSHFP